MGRTPEDICISLICAKFVEWEATCVKLGCEAHAQNIHSCKPA